jgi:hypothetical protein
MIDVLRKAICKGVLIQETKEEIEEHKKKLEDLQNSMDILCGVKDEKGDFIEGHDRWGGSIKKAYLELTGEKEKEKDE